MSERLKAKSTAKLTPQQEKMPDCNTRAAGKKDEERKSLYEAVPERGYSLALQLI